MMGSRLFGCVSACLALLGLASAARAVPVFIPASALSVRQAIPVVVFGANGRQTIEQFAGAHEENPSLLRRDYAASGIVRCGLAHGAGQLTLSNDVITTAAHVFFDESGRQRAQSCRFEVVRGDATVSVSISMKSIVAGSRDPYAIAAVHDWAVARLDMPIADATPYELAGPQKPSAPVKFIARGHIDWGDAHRLSLQDCRLRSELDRGGEGTREFSFDCETGDGASGGAVMTRDGVGKLCAVLVGYRSIDPDAALPFSPLHYNFVVTVEGAFRAAVVAMAQPALASANVIVAAGRTAPAN
jgi:hypothetical protein